MADGSSIRRRSEKTQLEYLKASIEDGDSIVYACEQVDLDEMRAWIASVC